MKYVVSNREFDTNSIENQRIKERFVNNNVICNDTINVEYIMLKALEDDDAPFMYEDIVNLYADDEAEEPQEIYEWYRVDSWFCEKLKEKGEPVIESGWWCYWGRTCTGQAILLDGVIDEITMELEILDGQKYSWSTK